MLSCELEKGNLTQICHGREPLLGVVSTQLERGHNIQFVSLTHFLIFFKGEETHTHKKLCDLSIFHGLPTLVLSAACPFFSYFLYLSWETRQVLQQQNNPLWKRKEEKKREVAVTILIGGKPCTSRGSSRDPFDTLWLFIMVSAPGRTIAQLCIWAAAVDNSVQLVYIYCVTLDQIWKTSCDEKSFLFSFPIDFF